MVEYMGLSVMSEVDDKGGGTIPQNRRKGGAYPPTKKVRRGVTTRC